MATVKEERERLQLSQAELADLAGIGLSTLRNIEYGMYRGRKEVVRRLEMMLDLFERDIKSPELINTESLFPLSPERADRGKKKTVAAQQLYDKRNARGWSQKHLAIMADVNIHTIRNIEQGHSQPGQIVKFRLANAMGLTTGELWGDKVGPFLLDQGPVAVYRRNHGMTRAALARQMGISVSTLIKLEQNNVYMTDEIYEKTADFLGMTKRQLILAMRPDPLK